MPLAKRRVADDNAPPALYGAAGSPASAARARAKAALRAPGGRGGVTGVDDDSGDDDGGFGSLSALRGASPMRAAAGGDDSGGEDGEEADAARRRRQRVSTPERMRRLERARLAMRSQVDGILFTIEDALVTRPHGSLRSASVVGGR